MPTETPGSAEDFAFDSLQYESGKVRQFGDYELLLRGQPQVRPFLRL
jgi:hypothetical protein